MKELLIRDLGRISSIFLAFVAILGLVGTFVIESMDTVIFVLSLFGLAALSLVLDLLYHKFKSVKIIKAQGKTITIRKGNLFEAEGIVVIPFNRFFDTIVDDVIISSSSLHGKFVTKYKQMNPYVNLDDIISKQLKSMPSVKCNRPGGKTEEYAPGMTVEVFCNDKRFFLLGLTHFDNYQKASCTVPEYCTAIDSLMNYINIHGQGQKISIPLIGGGLSRLGGDNGDILELLISLIKNGRYEYPKEITIVLSPFVSESIDLLSIR